MKYSINITNVSNLNSSLKVSYKEFTKALLPVILTSILILLYAVSVTQEVTLQ
jgi:hypothetical protein